MFQQWLAWFLSLIPGGPEAFEAVLHGSPTDKAKVFFTILLGLIGAAEVIKLLVTAVFRRRSKMQKQIEAHESRIHDLQQEIDLQKTRLKQLEQELAAERLRQPEAAIAKADRELQDRNEALALRHLEQWFDANAPHISRIALHIARFHIGRALPDPQDHLAKAGRMLRLAQSATPEDAEALDTLNELSAISACLQERMIQDGDTLIAWQADLGGTDRGRADRELAIIMTFRKVADYCHEKGLMRLAPSFADRAASLAGQAGPRLRPVWCQMETVAAFYWLSAGHAGAALDRLDRVLAEPFTILPARGTDRLLAQFYRAAVLRNLGRPAEALAEIDAFAPVQAEVRGARHPDTLTTRYLRAAVLRDLGRPAEALAEIDAFAPVEAEVKGARHPDTLDTRSLRIGIEIAESRTTDHTAALREITAALSAAIGPGNRQTLAARYRLARQLFNRGETAEALAELQDILATADPAVSPTHRLLRSVKALMAACQGGAVPDDLMA